MIVFVVVVLEDTEVVVVVVVVAVVAVVISGVDVHTVTWSYWQPRLQQLWKRGSLVSSLVHSRCPYSSQTAFASEYVFGRPVGVAFFCFFGFCFGGTVSRKQYKMHATASRKIA